MLTSTSRFTASLVTISAALAFSTLSAGPALAESKPIGKVLSVKQSGYATRLQQSVKHSIKPGDAIYSGDQLDVKSGNVVQVALDADKENIIHIAGDSVVQMTKDRAINLELSRGQVFALLDKLEAGTKFKVTTPTAVSTVRGTYFGVKMAGTATETSVYRGAVGVNGRLDNGKMLGSPIHVEAGDKTVVAHTGTQPAPSSRMSEAEFNRINEVIATLGGLKKPVNYNQLDFENTKQKANGSTDIEIGKNAKDKKLDEEAEAGGKVVF